MTQFLIVPGEPKGKGRPRFAQGHAYTPQATRDYENAIQTAYRITCGNYKFPDNANLKLEIMAYFKIPKATKKSDKLAMQNGEIMPTKTPDADNILKIVADALNGIAYSDDKQIIEMHVTKRYNDEGLIMIELSDVKEVTP